MENLFRVLIVDDSEQDVELIVHRIRRWGFNIEVQRVDTDGSMREALKHSSWDLILSDHTMPTFSSIEALDLRMELVPDMPFVIVSGNITEQLIASASQKGCKHFVSKNDLSHLERILCIELPKAIR